MRTSLRRWIVGIGVVVIVGGGVGAFLARERWFGSIPQGVYCCAAGAGEDHTHAPERSGEAAADEKHRPTAAGRRAPDEMPKSGPAGSHRHDETAAMRLSTAAQQNVGLKLAKVKLSAFERTITVPAMIVAQPGRTHVEVAAPVTGAVTRIWRTEGETVTPGQRLFELRLTHEEIVEAQAEFLKTAEELGVVKRELARLEHVAAEGAIAGKAILERKYEADKLEAALRSQRQRLFLHGLSPTQVDAILDSRTLLSSFSVAAPEISEKPADASSERLLQVERVEVQQGEHVAAGATLCVLADYAELYIEGKAFAEDAETVRKAADSAWRVTAVIAKNGREPTMVRDLRILYLANRIDPETRALLFYVPLANKVVRDRTEGGRRFTDWQFKPGQRVQLLVPVETWANRIVLPADAVVQDGAEAYVFEENEGHFDRRTVRVEYRDQYSAVLANDGAIAPGAVVVVSGAYQVHLAMKNKASGQPDPHAGHHH